MSETTTAERLIAAGHTPKLDEDGEVDNFAIEAGFHNGPACSICGEGRCEHCDDGRPFSPCPGQEEVDRKAKERRRQQYETLRAQFEAEAAVSTPALVEALREARDTIECLLSADPDMPTYQADYDAAENFLDRIDTTLSQLNPEAGE